LRDQHADGREQLRSVRFGVRRGRLHERRLHAVRTGRAKRLPQADDGRDFRAAFTLGTGIVGVNVVVVAVAVADADVKRPTSSSPSRRPLEPARVPPDRCSRSARLRHRPSFHVSVSVSDHEYDCANDGVDALMAPHGSVSPTEGMPPRPHLEALIHRVRIAGHGPVDTRVDRSRPVPLGASQRADESPSFGTGASVARYRCFRSPGCGYPSTCLDTSVAMDGCVQILAYVPPNLGIRAPVPAHGSGQTRLRMHPSRGTGVPETEHGCIRKGCSISPRRGLASPYRVSDAAKANVGTIRNRGCAHPRSITLYP
jgi:hypothetical protein